MSFDVKDSGERTQFESGMVRDTNSDKIDYTLALDGPMFERWATHLTKACSGPNPKYPPRNWMKANGPAEMERFRVSAMRHFIAWMRGETDEDHAAAVMFNLNGYEYVKQLMPEYRAHALVHTQMKDMSGKSIDEILGHQMPPVE